MKEKNTLKKRIKDRHPGIYLLLYVLKRVIKKDDEYIEKVLAYKKDREYIEIKHNGDVDHGKTVYVIKENSGFDGFCATVLFVLYYLIYAKQHGFAPKIRLTKHFTYYDEEKSKEIVNPWEYYFTGEEESLDENEARNVCYASYYHMQEVRERYDISAYKAENYTDERILQLCDPIVKKYLSLRPEIIKEAEDLLGSIRKTGGKILGVHFRGTDYRQGYNDHPVYVDEKQTVAEIKKAVETMGTSAVFLATDDASVSELIRDAIGDIPLLQHPDVYRSDGDESVAFSESGRKYHHYLLGYEIARDMYTLSLCDGLVAGKSSVSFLSDLYKHSRGERYEYMKIIDKGNNTGRKTYAGRFRGKWKDAVSGIIGIGENSTKLVEDFRYVFHDILKLGDRIEWTDQQKDFEGKYDHYFCCAFDHDMAVKALREAGLIYGKDYHFAEDCFYLLDDWKGSKIACIPDRGSMKKRAQTIIFEYAAKHGKLLPQDRYKKLLKGYYANEEGNFFSRHLTGDKGRIRKKIVYSCYLLLGALESVPRFFAGKDRYEKYDHICFYSSPEAVRFKKDHPALSDRVTTTEELKAHTMASLYMRAVYLDRRQNACACDLPFKTLWIGEGGTTRVCGCPDFLEISCGNAGVTEMKKIWNSPLARIIRLSVIDNTYTFCSRELCRKIRGNKDQSVLLERPDEKEGDHPANITIANDYACNLHCPSCRKTIHAKNSGDIEAGIAACTQALIDAGWLDKAEELIIGGSGETFLSENYRHILNDGIMKRNRILIMTNGTLFTPEAWEKMEGKYKHISFAVSIDAATAETYKKVRCGGDFERLMKNMEFLSGLRSEAKVDHVQVNMVVQKANYKEIPDFIRWAKRMGFDHVYLSNIWNWGTYTNDDFENNVSMFDRDGKMRPELAEVLEDPVCRDPMVDMGWEADA